MIKFADGLMKFPSGLKQINLGLFRLICKSVRKPLHHSFKISANDRDYRFLAFVVILLSRVEVREIRKTIFLFDQHSEQVHIK